MKKLAVIILACFAFQASQAQIDKGSLFLGGSVSFNTTKNETSETVFTKSNSFNISPQIGKAVQKNLVVGAGISVGMNNSENTGIAGTTKNSNNVYGLSVFVRKYYPVAGRFMLFGEGNVGANITDGNAKLNDTKVSEIKGWGAGINITPGITYNVSKKLWLEATLSNLFTAGYTSTTNKSLNQGQPVAETKNTGFNAGASVSGVQDIGIGVRWIL